MRRLPDESIKLLKYLALVVNQKFREAHYVHEKNMGDFETKLRFTLYGHTNSDRNIATSILSTSRSTVENKTGGVEHLWQRLVNFFDQNFLIPFYRKGRPPVRGSSHPGVGRTPVRKECFPQRTAALQPCYSVALQH